MNIEHKSDFVKIPYRDDKNIKKLSLDLNNEHDALFYESYMRLPLDNRNYMASLYAREKERGVNDSTGHRVQELALVTPKEDTVMMREKRNAEMESLKETLSAYESRIVELNNRKTTLGLNATEDAELTDLKKKRDSIKRRIRNLDSTWTKAVNAEIFSTGHLSGLNPLTRDALKESLDKVAESMSKEVVAFLEDKFDNLPAKANGEDGSEQFVMTNAVYLTALCQLIPLDISKLGEEIKRLYALLNSINKDTLTKDAFDAYKPAIDFIVRGLNKVENMSVPDYLTNTQPDVLIEQIKPICATIKFALGRAVYITYTEAEQRNLPRWNEIKGWLDRSNTFKSLYENGKDMFTFRDNDKYKNTTEIYKKLRGAIESAAEQIWSKWCSVKSAQKAFAEAVARLNNPKQTRYIGTLYYTKKKNKNPNTYATVELWVQYNIKDNSISVTRIKVLDTKFEQDLQNVTVPDWFDKEHKESRKDGNNKNGYYVYPYPAIPIEEFKRIIADSILSELHIDADGSIPVQIKEALITPSSAGIDMFIDDIDESGAAQYRSFDSPEQKFNNIIDMGNPLKDIRSRRRYK